MFAEMDTGVHGPSEVWFTDIARACDELGLGIVRVEASAIDVITLAEKAEIRIESHFLSGHLLRRIFAKPKEA